MSSAFRSFLIHENAKPDPAFTERDESHFVLALLLLRLGFHGEMGRNAYDGIVAATEHADDPLASIQASTETVTALKFVGTFLCFFAIKPATFARAIQQFKQNFIPGFADDEGKRVQLFRLANSAFSQNSLQPERWRSLETFFRVSEAEAEQEEKRMLTR